MAAGESQSLTRYELLDSTAPDGLSYYRLRMVDQDGEGTYSDIITVDRTDGRPSVFPNPASDRIQWETVEGAVDLKVYDALGKCVISRRAPADASRSISIEELPPGHYSIVLLDDQGHVLMRNRFVRSQAPIAP